MELCGYCLQTWCDGSCHREHIARREAQATHKCAVCGALWIEGDEFWSLASEDCEGCCNNDRMDRPNIIPLKGTLNDDQ